MPLITARVVLTYEAVQGGDRLDHPELRRTRAGASPPHLYSDGSSASSWGWREGPVSKALRAVLAPVVGVAMEGVAGEPGTGGGGPRVARADGAEVAVAVAVAVTVGGGGGPGPSLP